MAPLTRGLDAATGAIQSKKEGNECGKAATRRGGEIHVKRQIRAIKSYRGRECPPGEEYTLSGLN